MSEPLLPLFVQLGSFARGRLFAGFCGLARGT